MIKLQSQIQLGFKNCIDPQDVLCDLFWRPLKTVWQVPSFLFLAKRPFCGFEFSPCYFPHLLQYFGDKISIASFSCVSKRVVEGQGVSRKKSLSM